MTEQNAWETLNAAALHLHLRGVAPFHGVMIYAASFAVQLRNSWMRQTQSSMRALPSTDLVPCRLAVSLGKVVP